MTTLEISSETLSPTTELNEEIRESANELNEQWNDSTNELSTDLNKKQFYPKRMSKILKISKLP